VNVDGVEALDELVWSPSLPLTKWSKSKLNQSYNLILHTTGESYSPERLAKLPLDEKYGIWVLHPQDSSEQIQGLLWVMQLSKTRCRVLAFSVSRNLQGQGFGSVGWKLFINAASEAGIRSIQLEVRQDNFIALRMYEKRGLKPIGKILGYYRGNDGWLMLGPIVNNQSSQ
jgi:ribosomal protein S18 acetylase RimI-like enzyme